MTAAEAKAQSDFAKAYQIRPEVFKTIREAAVRGDTRVISRLHESEATDIRRLGYRVVFRPSPPPELPPSYYLIDWSEPAATVTSEAGGKAAVVEACP